ncbi:MAG: hypothetical protein U0R64_00040 [Candidatus Nanopelagicales bacterium]
MPQILLLVAGVLICLVTADSVIRTLVVPRGVTSRIAGAISRVVFAWIRGVARRTSSYEARDRVLTPAAPLVIIIWLFSWLLLFMFGFALILMVTGQLAFPDAWHEAGSSLLTLGFAWSGRVQLSTVDFIAAATGPVVIGLLIGFLPALYASYNRRERMVTVMHARASEPNWGPEVLARQAMLGSLDQLPVLWHEWELWAADVSESHTSYPILIGLRSTKPRRNWAVALLAAMDAAALQLAVAPALPQGSARMMLRQGMACFGDLAALQGYQSAVDPVLAEPQPERVTLTQGEFHDAVARLSESGFPCGRTGEDAWLIFRRWRSFYEEQAYYLCDRIDAVPAPWSGPRTPPLPVERPTSMIHRTVD